MCCKWGITGVKHRQVNTCFQVRPDVAIISSGRWNPWKFPHYLVMERFHRYKSAVENTAVSGQVRVNFSRPIRNPASSHRIFPWYVRVIGLSKE